MDCLAHQLPDEPLWFCVRSQIKHEHIATAHLRKLGDVDVICPRIRYQKATRQGPSWWTEAMFPNYIFARFNPVTRLTAVRYAHGVCKIVSFGGRYTVLPNQVVDDLRQQLGEDDIRVMVPEFKTGDEIQLARGSLVGLSAVITQIMPGKDRVRILMDFLGRMTEFEVNLGDIAPVMSPSLHG
jgi:transcriptional antiterminator RfaH